MAFQVYPSHSTGDIMSAAVWNANMVSNFGYLYSPPAGRQRLNNGQSLTYNSNAVIPYAGAGIDGFLNGGSPARVG